MYKLPTQLINNKNQTNKTNPSPRFTVTKSANSILNDSIFRNSRFKAFSVNNTLIEDDSNKSNISNTKKD
jgi:hypothetical protein